MARPRPPAFRQWASYLVWYHLVAESCLWVTDITGSTKLRAEPAPV